VFIRGLNKPREMHENGPDAKTKQDDYFRNFRTKTVLLWAFTNALIVALLTNDAVLDSVYDALKFTPVNDFNPYLKVCEGRVNREVYLLQCCVVEFCSLYWKHSVSGSVLYLLIKLLHRFLY
jgi:hypothetical protein